MNTDFGWNEMSFTSKLFIYFFVANRKKNIHIQMAKSINSKQSEILLGKMQENPDIARGFVKENKIKISAFWKQLTEELNSAGPPIKTEFEWKKVWTDQKRYVRKKAALNKVHEKGTGGGPNKTQKFSPTEEAIFQLIGMKEAIEGVSSSQSFGVNCPQKRKMDDRTNEESIELLLEQIQNNNESNQNCDETDLPSVSIRGATENSNDQAPAFASTSQSTQRRKIGKMSTHEVVVEELQTQKELCEKVGEAISVMKEQNKNFESCFKKLYRSLDILNDRKKEQLKEEKRHNSVMENFRKEEIENMIEKNRKMIELEEMKIDMMREDKVML